MVVKDECVRDFVKHSDRFHEGSVWSGGCRVSGYIIEHPINADKVYNCL